jgi:hypothetical protein
MLSKIKKHLTYANVMASILAFVVLGGGMAVAAGLKKNSVKAKQIAANAVKTAELAAGSVTTDKLADGAATGAKVDEATLGKVPSAVAADTAGTADSAATAQNAENAANAQNAQQAQSAADAALLAGKTLGQVRSTLITDDATADDALSIAEELVDGLVVNAPAVTGDALVIATVTLQNNGAAQAAPSCRLRSNGTPISEHAFVTLEPGNFGTLTLIGLDEDVKSAQVAVSCAGGSAVNDDVKFAAGNLIVEKAPNS